VNRLFIFLAALIVATPAYAEWLWAGQRGRVDDSLHNHSDGGGWWACRSYNDLTRFEQLRRDQDDPEAAFEFAARNCAKLRDGTEVVVEETTFFHQWLRVRPRTQLDCFWMDDIWISKIR
jgi:hypothetical protein